MSSAVVSTSAALGRPFVFDDESEPELLCHTERSAKRSSRGVEGSLLSADSRLARVVPASRLEIRSAPEMASSGIPAIDALTGGLPRGCLTELCGPASSGRTTVLLAALAAATRRGEFCVVVDASDALDPHSAAAAGVDLDRLLWVRCGEDSPQRHPSTSLRACPEPVERVGTFEQTAFSFDGKKSRASEHRVEQVLRATDLLLESGGFGLIILDLADLPLQTVRRIPLTTWFRFRRTVENKPTILLAIEHHPIAGSCSSLLLKLEAAKRRENAAHGASRGWDPENDRTPEGRKKNCAIEKMRSEFLFPSHAHLLNGLEINAELIRSRLDRKPARSIAFETRTAWAG